MRQAFADVIGSHLRHHAHDSKAAACASEPQVSVVLEGSQTLPDGQVVPASVGPIRIPESHAKALEKAINDGAKPFSKHKVP